MKCLKDMSESEDKFRPPWKLSILASGLSCGCLMLNSANAFVLIELISSFRPSVSSILNLESLDFWSIS
jgi:hypothetical protein